MRFGASLKEEDKPTCMWLHVVSEWVTRSLHVTVLSCNISVNQSKHRSLNKLMANPPMIRYIRAVEYKVYFVLNVD